MAVTPAGWYDPRRGGGAPWAQPPVAAGAGQATEQTLGTCFKELSWRQLALLLMFYGSYRKINLLTKLFGAFVVVVLVKEIDK